MLFIKKRIIEEANYIIKHNATLRETAKHFKLGKSTIHKDMNDRLKNINTELKVIVVDKNSPLDKMTIKERTDFKDFFKNY